jgi:hypothetical protein
MPTNRIHFRAPGLFGLAACAAVLLLIPVTANAQPVDVITVDCTPFVPPSGSSFGPTNTMGMALQAVDLGGDFNVQEVTPAAFRMMTAAQLSAFDLIAVNNHPYRLGDNCIAGAGNGLGTTWHSVVGVNGGGRVVLNSHDAPRFKMLAPTPGPPLLTGFEPFGTHALIRQAALWAGGLPGLTGLLIFNDAARFTSGPGIPIGGVGWDNPELNLPAAWGIVDADQSGGSFMNGGYTDILPAFAAHPLYVGISDARFAQNTISSFSANFGDTSFHSVFAAYNAAMFTATEQVINSGTIDVGGMCPCVGNAAMGPDGLAITLIREEICDPDPRTQGYWHRQCLGAGLITPGRMGRGPQEVLEPDFKNLVPSVDTILENTVAEFGGTCGGGMDANPPSDPCERALKQYTAFLLNMESGRLQESCVIDLSVEGCSSTTIGGLVNELAGLINSGDTDNCKQAAACAGTINEHEGVGVCDPGRDDCDGQPLNGCEVDLNSDPDNCGSCGNVCALPGTVGTCEAGVCVQGPCSPGFDDCDGDPANGCETSIAGDPDNCGACGVACSFSNADPLCVSGACQMGACRPGWGDCDGDPANGCETNIAGDPNNCGTCGVACSFTNADPLCVGGACQMGACQTGWGDCDGDPANGCEVDLTTDPNHCGGCGNLCNLPNASSVCAGATCQVGQCDPLFDDCDLISSNGCETSLQSLSNCGACGVTCDLMNAAESCSTGTCRVTSCSSGWGNCDGFDANGCERSLQTLSDCGVCGVICDLAHASESCLTGSCQLTSCDSGYGDCDSTLANGCERSLRTLTDCGFCNVSCDLPNAGESCSTGTCLLTGCAPSFSSCDGQTGNGCEVGHKSYPNSCTTAAYVGSKCGDTHCGFFCPSASWQTFATKSGRTSVWYRARANECSSCPASIQARITLSPPSGTDYDLYVYSACGTEIGRSINAGSATDQVTVSMSDDGFVDDTYYYWVEVRHYSGASCSSWNLSFAGKNCS